jgi:hypothetical protein
VWIRIINGSRSPFSPAVCGEEVATVGTMYYQEKLPFHHPPSVHDVVHQTTNKKNTLNQSRQRHPNRVRLVQSGLFAKDRKRQTESRLLRFILASPDILSRFIFMKI